MLSRSLNFAKVVLYCAATLVPAVARSQCIHASELSSATLEIQLSSEIAVYANLGNEESTTGSAAIPSLGPCKDAFVSLRLHEITAKKLGVETWFAAVRKKPESRRHQLEIREENYVPSTLAIRAGDSIVDPEYRKWRQPLESVNGITFRRLVFNPPQNPGMETYLFRYEEKEPIEIRNDTYHHRLAYLFVSDHSCAALSNADGLVTFHDLPYDVDLPMRIQFPWYPLEKTKFESPTLKLNEKGWFELRVTHGGKNRHVIKIFPKPVKLE